MILYGYSDDLLEFEGFITDEVGAYEGISHDDLDNEYPVEIYDLMKKYEISLNWCPDDEKSWAFSVKDGTYYEKFNIIEDGEVFCEGIVIQA